jgi:hypothetical protein
MAEVGSRRSSAVVGPIESRRGDSPPLFVGEDAVDDEDDDDGVDFLFRVPTTASSYGAGAS